MYFLSLPRLAIPVLVAASLLLTTAARAQTPAWTAAAIGSSSQAAGASSIAATAVDNAGNIYVVGGVSGTFSLGSNLLVARGNSDLFIAKFIPATSTWAWAQTAGGTSDEGGQAIAVSTVGGVTSIYITGNIANNTGNTKDVRFGTVGNTLGPLTQSGTSPATSSDIVVAKYIDHGSSATVAWTQVGGGVSNEAGTGIAVSTVGTGTSVYVISSIINNSANASVVVFGGSGLTAGTLPQAGTGTLVNADVVVAKYVDNGNSATLGWTQAAGGTDEDKGYGVAASGSSVYITGYTTNNAANDKVVRFGGSGLTPGTVVQAGASATTSLDLFVAKFTDNGGSASVSWTQTGGGTGDDIGNAIAVNAAVSPTRVYITGAITNSTANTNSVLLGGTGLASGTVPQYGASPVSSQDLLVAQYADNGTSAALGWAQVGGGSGPYEMGAALAVSGPSVLVTGRISNDLANTSRVVFGGTGTIAGTVAQPGSSPVSSVDLAVAKYTDNGNSSTLRWTQVGGGSTVDGGTGIALSPAGVFVVGYVGNGGSGGRVTFGTASGSPLFGTIVTRAVISQLADTGSVGNWQQLVAFATGGASRSLATAADAAGNVFVTGYFYGQVLFGNTLLSSRGYSDIFVAKYVPATNTWAWALSAGAPARTRATALLLAA